jgi:hypothetical protein
MRTLIISQAFFVTSIANFRLLPTAGTACTTEPRTSSAAIAQLRPLMLIEVARILDALSQV